MKVSVYLGLVVQVVMAASEEPVKQVTLVALSHLLNQAHYARRIKALSFKIPNLCCDGDSFCAQCMLKSIGLTIWLWCYLSNFGALRSRN